MLQNSNKYFLCLAIFLLGNIAKAQLNESDSLKFQLRTSITGNFQKGNVEMFALKGKLDATIGIKEKVVIKTQNSSLYQAFYQKKADNDVFSRNYLYYQPHRKIYPYLIGYVNSNFRRKIQTRFFSGLGATYQAIQKENTIFKLSANIVYEQTKFNALIYNKEQYNGNNKIKVWRATAYIAGQHWLLKKKLRFFYDAYWQPSLTKKINYRIQTDAGIDFTLWKGLAFNTLYSFTYENIVPVTNKKTDQILTFGISYQFKSKQNNNQHGFRTNIQK